jgi:hypothetical protein
MASKSLAYIIDALFIKPPRYLQVLLDMDNAFTYGRSTLKLNLIMDKLHITEYSDIKIKGQLRLPINILQGEPDAPVKEWTV